MEMSAQEPVVVKRGRGRPRKFPLKIIETVPTNPDPASVNPATRTLGIKDAATRDPTTLELVTPVSVNFDPPVEDDTDNSLSKSTEKELVTSLFAEFDVLKIEFLTGNAYYSDDDTHEKLPVSKRRINAKRARSSSVVASSNQPVSIKRRHRTCKRNVSTQVTTKFQENTPGTIELLKTNFLQHISEVKKRHQKELSMVKRTQWCFICDKASCYYCCWNTTYCSKECQKIHWEQEHKQDCKHRPSDGQN